MNRYPDLSERIQSSFIDLLVVVAMMGICATVIDNYENTPDWVRFSLFVAVFLVYEPVSMTFGCTIGNYIKGIRVKKHSDTTKRINILQALVRYPVKTFLGWVSFLTIHSNAERRAIHDFVAGSVMIKVS